MPSSNENNVIYLRSSEWGGGVGGVGGHDKKQQISSSGVVCT